MTKKRNKSAEWMAATLTLIIGMILVPIIVDQVQSVDTSNWTFTGSIGAVTLFGLLPFVFISGIVIYFIASILGKT